MVSTPDFESGNPGSNPGTAINIVDESRLLIVAVFIDVGSAVILLVWNEQDRRQAPRVHHVAVFSGFLNFRMPDQL